MKEEVNNIFRKSYEQHESHVDPEAIWEGIESKRNQKKRPKLFILFLSCFLLMVVFALGYIWYGDEDSQSDATLVNVTTASEVSSQNKETQSKLKIDANIADGVNEGISESKKSNSGKTKDVSQYQNRTEVVPNVKANDHPTQSQQKTSVKERRSLTNSPEKQEEIDKQTRVNIAQTSKVRADKQISLSKIKSNETTVQQSNPNQTALDQISLLPSRSWFLNMNQESSVELDVKNIDIKKCSLQDGLFTLDVFGGVGLFSEKYSSKDQAYDQLRTETEVPLEFIHAGVLLSYQIQKFGLSTGILYSRFNSKFSNVNRYFGTENQEVLSLYNANSFDQELVNLGSNETIILYSEMQVRYNAIETYSIPFMLNYRFTMGNLYVEPRIGLNFHVYQVVEQSVVSPNGELVKLDHNDISINSDKVAGVSLYYPISSFLQLGVQFQGMHRRGEGLYGDQITFGGSIGLGVRYILF